MEDIVIGIDLGTTNTCAAYYYDNNLKVFENAEGKSTTPSVVFFSTPKNPVVGDYAKKMANHKSELAVFEIKRLIGRQKNNFDVNTSLKYFPFILDPDIPEPTITIQHKDTVIKKNSSEISAIILSKIKEDVEARLKHKIKKAVITVPAYFNVSQREETLKAAKIAGFQVLKLLNEPTAAALTYYFFKKSEKLSHYSLVYDLGGGTFDVAILKKSNDNIEIICVDGDSHLGGVDFDQKIFDYACAELTKQNVDIKNDRRKTRRLLSLCEEAKKDLSNKNIIETQLDLNYFDSSNDAIYIPLKKQHFETMIESYIERTIQIVINCLRTSKLSKTDIAEIILVGGSSRIPKIQEMLSKYFDNKKLNKFLNPDECVAKGAALQAALLATNTKQKIESIKISEVTPSSLGVSEFCNRMSVIIPKNSIIPVKKTVTYVNPYDQQTAITLRVYEGERLDVKKNIFLSTLTINDLTPSPPEQCEVTVEMSVDNNGILKVTAQEKLKNNTKDLKVTYTKSVSNETDIKYKIQSIEEYEEEDRKFDEFVTWKSYLLSYSIEFCYNIEQRKLCDDYKDVYATCKRIQKEVMGLDVKDEKRVKDVTEMVTTKCNPIVSKYKFSSMPETPATILNHILKKTSISSNKSDRQFKGIAGNSKVQKFKVTFKE